MNQSHRSPPQQNIDLNPLYPPTTVANIHATQTNPTTPTPAKQGTIEWVHGTLLDERVARPKSKLAGTIRWSYFTIKHKH